MKHFSVAIKLFIPLILFALLANLQYSISQEFSFRESWYDCIDYVTDGTLYGGQPFCVQGPVFFHLLWLLQLFGNVPFLLSVLIVLTHVTIIGFILFLHKLSKAYYILLLSLYTSIIFYPFALSDPAVSIATFFAFTGYFILCGKSKHKELFTGLFFSLALFTKLIVMPAILILAALHFLQTKQIQKTTYLLIPTIIAGTIYKILYPRIFQYLFLASHYEPLPLLALLKRVLWENALLLNPFNWVVYVVLIISFFLLRKYKTIPAYIASYGLLFTFLIVNRHVIYYARYYMLYFVFFLLTCFSYLKQQACWKKTFVTVLIILFIIPSVFLIAIDASFVSLKKEVNRPLSFIPKLDGAILGEAASKQHFTTFFSDHLEINAPQLTLLTPLITIDTGAMPGFKHYGINTTISNTKNQAIIRSNTQTALEINNATFDIIIWGFPEEQLFNHLNTYTIDATIKDKYCYTQLPYVYFADITARNYLAVLLRDRQMCLALRQETLDYYMEHEQSICKKSNTAYSSFYFALKHNLYDLPYTCADKLFDVWNIYGNLHKRKTALAR